jgi:hypothetical protein
MDNILFPQTTTPALFGGPTSKTMGMPNPYAVKPKGVPPTAASYAENRAMAQNAATQAGIDPQEYIRWLSYRSALNPTARNQGAGIAALPPSVRGGVDAQDTGQSLDYTANLLKSLQMLRAMNG